MSSIVGPSLSDYLDIPLLSFATKIALSDNKITADSSYEEGITTVEAKLPALVTVSREINQPRFPTLIQIMSAGKKEMIEWNAQALGLDQSSAGKNASKLELQSLSVPLSARKKILFEGKPEDTAKQLAEVLTHEGVDK